ncbi:MAG: glycosyltransferase [Cytophagales bacterium]|nr:glycosyltransferase [Cytophagales bacterium]
MMYSIIIPHKNAVVYLKRLLESIPNRNDIQVVVVDDRSREDLLPKLTSLCQQYLNVELYANDGNRGAGASRNIGLSKVKGDWVIFADSDDFFNDSFTKQLDSLPNPEGCDIVFFKVNSIDSDSYKTAHRHQFFNALIDGYIERGEKDVLYKYSVPWGKVYSRKLIEANGIQFSEVVAGNDMFFACSCGIKAKTYQVRNEVLYVVTVREGSIVNTITSEYFLSRFNETLKVNNLLKELNLVRFQYSVLYFLFNSYKFDFKTFVFVLKSLFQSRSNILIGIEKILRFRAVLKDRENRKK